MELTVILVAQDLTLSAYEITHVLLKPVCVLMELLHVHFPVFFRTGITCCAFDRLACFEEILNVVLGKIEHIIVFILSAVDHAFKDQAAGRQPLHRFADRCTGNIQFIGDFINLQFAAGTQLRCKDGILQDAVYCLTDSYKGILILNLLDHFWRKQFHILIIDICHLDYLLLAKRLIKLYPIQAKRSIKCMKYYQNENHFIQKP